MRAWIEAAEDRIRTERDTANRAHIEREGIACRNRLLSGADCSWTQAEGVTAKGQILRFGSASALQLLPSAWLKCTYGSSAAGPPAWAQPAAAAVAAGPARSGCDASGALPCPSSISVRRSAFDGLLQFRFGREDGINGCRPFSIIWPKADGRFRVGNGVKRTALHRTFGIDGPAGCTRPRSECLGLTLRLSATCNAWPTWRTAWTAWRCLPLTSSQSDVSLSQAPSRLIWRQSLQPGPMPSLISIVG